MRIPPLDAIDPVVDVSQRWIVLDEAAIFTTASVLWALGTVSSRLEGL
jgi:hypothetical protein